MIAPRRRAEPAAADHEAGAAVRQRRATAPSCSSAAVPGAVGARRRHDVVLAEHVVQVDARAGDDRCPSRSPWTPRCEAAFPPASTTHTWVVDGGAEGSRRRRAPRRPGPARRRPRRSARRAAAPRARHGGGSRTKRRPARGPPRASPRRGARSAGETPGWPRCPSRSSSAERECDQHAAGRRRRVRRRTRGRGTATRTGRRRMTR